MAAILDDISAQHQRLLELTQQGAQDEASVSQAQEFLLKLASAGGEVADPRARSWLRGLIRYWGSYIYDQLGHFPQVELLPIAEYTVATDASQTEITPSARSVSLSSLRTGGAPLLGPFKIIDLIGQGGFYVVFKAIDIETNTFVALKILQPKRLEESPQLEDHFLQYEQMTARLKHPHVIPILAVETYDGVHCIAMPYIQGGSLADRIKETEWQPSCEEIIKIAHQVADGLAYIHSQGLVHRDIKPSNILMTPDDHVYLTDFGIHQILEAGDTAITVGTATYMAPEAIQNPASIDARTDLYAFGVLLYRLLSGQLPFQADSKAELFRHHIHSPVPPLVGIPNKIALLVYKCLEKDPGKRFQNANELKVELEHILPPKRRGVFDRLIGFLKRSKTLIAESSLITDLDRAETNGFAPDSTSAHMTVYLIVEGGETAYPDPIPLSRPVYHLGRDPDLTTIVFHDLSVSRLHARIQERKGAYWIYDKSDTSGTYVNNELVPPDGQLLHDNDIMNLGKVRLRFVIAEIPKDEARAGSTEMAVSQTSNLDDEPTEGFVFTR